MGTEFFFLCLHIYQTVLYLEIVYIHFVSCYLLTLIMIAENNLIAQEKDSLTVRG